MGITALTDPCGSTTCSPMSLPLSDAPMDRNNYESVLGLVVVHQHPSIPRSLVTQFANQVLLGSYASVHCIPLRNGSFHLRTRKLL